jgi:FlaA1/EpsC-like NDP-sugar epimerase
VRQLATACIDGGLVILSFYLAFSLSGGAAGTSTSLTFVLLLPLVFSAQMMVLALFRSSSRVWRYTNSHDLAAIAGAGGLGTLLAMAAAVAVYGSAIVSPAVFVLDAMLLTGLLAASRLMLRGLSEMLRPTPSEGARVLIYGAGDAGVTLLQELRGNSSLGRVVVGFLDDDATKVRARIQGLPVFGGGEVLGEILRLRSVREVIVATSKLPSPRVEAIAATCAASGVLVSRFRVAIQHVPVQAHLRRPATAVESARPA